MPTMLNTDVLIPRDAVHTRDRVIGALRNWHNENHTATVEHCYEEPCRAIYQAADEGEDDHSLCLPLRHDCEDECEHNCRRCGQQLVCTDQAEHDAKRAETAKRVAAGVHTK